MKLKTFSPKQAEILKFAYSKTDTIICDGAVRSGKTIVMSLAFSLWAMENFNNTNFALCSKTVTSAERNLLKPFMQIEGLPYDMKYNRSSRMLTIKCGKKINYFYLFGGKDESSYTLIQGLTLAGVLFDEVALMPKSFVDQGISRTLSFENSKIWFNCNPESPNHWFYTDYLKDKSRKCKHLHFLMKDNPVMTPAMIKKAEAKFTGVFYDRYIRGLWVRAEGVIYRYFIDHKSEYMIPKSDLPSFARVHVGVDIGGRGSQHAFVASGISEDYRDVYVLKSQSVPAVDTDTDFIVQKYMQFAKSVEEQFGVDVDLTFSDSAEQAIKNSLHNASGRPVLNSVKNKIIDRIRCEDMMIAQRRLHIVSTGNDDLIDGLENAVWDDASPLQDTRLDDGTSNIDIMDAFEYSWEKYIRNLLR